MPPGRTAVRGYTPQLDRAALRRLAGAVRGLQEAGGAAVPARQLLELARTVGLDAGVTIDFEAVAGLGQPLVVLRCGPRTGPAPCLSGLSRREWEVVALVAAGLSNKQIARRLVITLGTVKDHVHRILRKTALPNRAALAAAYLGHQGAQPGA
jgi:DNA-binding NarL/FixJ family response regulator